MTGAEFLVNLLSKRWYAEAAYYGGLLAIKEGSATSHMLAGAACCGYAEPAALAQRILEGAPVAEDVGPGGLRVSPQTSLPYDGFFHLVEARRLDPSISAPATLRSVFDAIADDLAYFSRREFHASADRPKKYSLRIASVSAALLLRQLTGSDRELPGVAPITLETAREILQTELAGSGGDASFFMSG
jgi:hypothetical protein